MNPMLNTGLALIAIVILATALSATKDGARLVQAGIVIAIVVVILKNSNAVQDAAGNLTRMVSSAPKQSSGSGGN
jgi:hypothetical protein